MALSYSRPRSGSLSGGSLRLLPGSSAGSVRGNSSGSDSWFSLSRLHAALPAARASLDQADPILLGPGRQQEALQSLNERLAGYLQRVRGLEAANRGLEEEIAAIRARRAGAVGHKDWEACERPLAELRKQVEDLNLDNVKLLLQIDNARLAADDFKHKLEAEQAVCDSVQKDTHGLRKMIDDTNFLRMKLEGELESLREELAHLRKSHKEEVEALNALIANSDVTVQVDNPQKQDLSERIAEIRSQYEQVAEQNRAEAENWYKNKFDSMSQEADVNTQALEEAKSELTELRRQLQGLEIEHQTLQKMVDTLENTLKNTENHYHNDLANLNRIIIKLQDDLAACRADLERQARDYEALLDLKTKLENEIEHYRSLIEGATDRRELQNSGKVDTRRQTIKKVVVMTQDIVNGQVVAQTSEEVFQ
ncbi:keratin, type I cytoskeletal 18-like isoform X1 [Paroedura picta]|uniref:keratin, type I cytoskeletal 18-like isoform X1 n=1 Tax=Paroedura picta TaxID=143630 RepID=UPI0040575711